MFNRRWHIEHFVSHLRWKEYKRRFIMDLFFSAENSILQHMRTWVYGGEGRCFLHNVFIQNWHCALSELNGRVCSPDSIFQVGKGSGQSCSVKIMFENTVYFFVNTVNTPSLVVLMIQDFKLYSRIAYLKIYFKLHPQLIDRSDFSIK